MRFWRKRAGPGEVRRTARAMVSNIGKRNGNAGRTQAMSKRRLATDRDHGLSFTPFAGSAERASGVRLQTAFNPSIRQTIGRMWTCKGRFMSVLSKGSGACAVELNKDLHRMRLRGCVTHIRNRQALKADCFLGLTTTRHLLSPISAECCRFASSRSCKGLVKRPENKTTSLSDQPNHISLNLLKCHCFVKHLLDSSSAC
jgi:hypothetical protein